jgi:hypothetical protein
MLPIADCQCRFDDSQGVRIILRNGSGFHVARDRLVKAFEFLEQISPVIEALRPVGAQRHRAVVARQRLIVSLEPFEGDAAVVERLGVTRL